jgi:hypothetical protein
LELLEIMEIMPEAVQHLPEMLADQHLLVLIFLLREVMEEMEVMSILMVIQALLAIRVILV